MDPIEFDAEVREGRGGGAWVEVPLDVKEIFGSGRPKVVATFDGHPYRGSIASMKGCWVLGMPKAIRSAIGKDVGDAVGVTLAPDEAPRTVVLPPDLESALADAPEARAFFESLSFTARREYARWVGGAKREETRARRLAEALSKLGRGERL